MYCTYVEGKHVMVMVGVVHDDGVEPRLVVCPPSTDLLLDEGYSIPYNTQLIRNRTGNNPKW